MPLSQVYGAQSLIKAGVCTSSTRPASPFEGQLIYETDTDRLAAYNGSVWVTQNGLQVVKAETSFSAVSSITADNVFSSTYTNYKIFIRFTSSTTASVQIKLRASAVGASTNYNFQYLTAFNASTGAQRTTGNTSGIIAYGTGGSFVSSTELFLSGPNLAEATSYMSNSNSSDTAFTAPYVNLWYGNHSTATAYDGIEIFTASGNITGTYTIYGLSK